MFENLKGKKALITGATGSIGESVARTLLSLGVDCAITSTRQEKINSLAQSFEGLEGKPVPLVSNLSDRDSSKSLIETANAELGGLDFLICNAGCNADNISVRMSLEDWDKVIETNLTSSFILAQSAAKLMMKKRFGRVIFISSVVGFTGNPGQANYVSSKSGLVGLSKTFAIEFAQRNINVNCIAPGFIESNMTVDMNDKQKEAIMQKIPSKKYGTPTDISNGVLYLVSDMGNYITGSTLHINGGMYTT